MSTHYRLHERCGSPHSSEPRRSFAFASSTRHFERPRPFLIEHLALDLTLDIPTKSVRGWATLDLRRLDPDARSLALDAVGFVIERVRIDGNEAPFTYDGQQLLLDLGPIETARVAVEYRATPRRGLYFLEPDDHVPSRPRQVWSQCQEEDARHWFPCHDKPHLKMTTELSLEVPNGWTVLSNGELVSSTQPASGPWRFHWAMRQPHPSYLVTLVAGEFAILEDRAGEVPLTYLVPKGREDDAKRTFARTPAMIQLFSELTGVPFPWNKYAQVVVSDFFFGGMENTTATTLYEHVLLDPRASLDLSSDDLISHELAHQWFGDFVTCRDWSEGWLNEGFATYFEHVWREKNLGQDEYDYGVRADLETYVSETHSRYKRPVVCLEYDAPLDLFDRHLYEKGGLVLHALRAELGSGLFWRGVNLYLSRHARGIVETRDLQRALEDVSGRSFGRAFEQWLYRPGHPELEVTVTWELVGQGPHDPRQQGLLTVAVKQTQSEGAPFELPLVVDIGVREGGVRRERRLITQKAETFVLQCPLRPAFVVVDPQLVILGEVTLKAPNDLLRGALAGAPTGRGRWLAARALAKADDPLTIGALGECLLDEQVFWGTRSEAAASLGKIRAREAFDLLAKATAVKHPKVRRAGVEALGAFRTTAALEALRPSVMKDDSYLVEGEAARALGKTRQAAAFEPLLDLLGRPSWGEVIRAGAIDGLAALRDDRAVPHLQALTRYGHPSRARRAAVLALPNLSNDRRTRELLEALLDDVDPMVRYDVIRALQDLGDVKARGALRERLERDLDARVRRRIREALRDLGEARRGLDPLKDELEKLQTEHAELKARLAKLEARDDGKPVVEAKKSKRGRK